MSAYQIVLLLLFGVLVVLAVYAFWPKRRNQRQSNSSPERGQIHSINREDERYWLGGMIYNNPDDPDLLVPKRFVPGRTLNVGHPLGRLVFIGMLLFVLVMAFLTAAGIVTPFGCHPSGCSF